VPSLHIQLVGIRITRMGTTFIDVLEFIQRMGGWTSQASSSKGAYSQELSYSVELKGEVAEIIEIGTSTRASDNWEAVQTRSFRFRVSDLKKSAAIKKDPFERHMVTLAIKDNRTLVSLTITSATKGENDQKLEKSHVFPYRLQ
jgi:hypothetical protein